MTGTSDILAISRVIPVAVIPRADDALAIAEALLRGGVCIIEVTLRTPDALDSIARISEGLPEMCVGAGTVWSGREARDAVDAGARFLVSPGRSDGALKASIRKDIPYLPGAQTVSEVAFWQKKRMTAVKFFPASVAGGVPALKAFGSVFPEIKFCPTGGISAANAADYLALPNVPCLGGSWLVPKDAVADRNWARIKQLASEASLLGTDSVSA